MHIILSMDRTSMFFTCFTYHQPSYQPAPIVDVIIFDRQQSIAVASSAPDVQVFRVEYKDRRLVCCLLYS